MVFWYLPIFISLGRVKVEIVLCKIGVLSTDVLGVSRAYKVCKRSFLDTCFFACKSRERKIIYFLLKKIADFFLTSITFATI